MTYTKQTGVKTSKKLDKIIEAAQNHRDRHFKGYEINGIPFSQFCDTKRMKDLRRRFEAEVDNIGGVDYTFGDCMA